MASSSGLTVATASTDASPPSPIATTPTSTSSSPSSTSECNGQLLFLSPGSTLKSWTHRFLFLHKVRRTLIVFSDEAAFRTHMRAFGSNFLHLISLSSSFVYVADYVDKPFAFEISCPTGNFFFAAKDEAEMKKWMGYLMEVGTSLKAPEKELVLYSSLGSTQFQRKVTESFAKYGFLKKRGEWNKAFKTRFFRTTENAAGAKVIVYYESPESTKHKGVISLQDAKIEDGGANGLEFSIVLPNRTFSMQAATKKDKNSWIKVLTILSGGDASHLTSADGDDNAEPTEAETASTVALTEDLYGLLGLDGERNPSQHDIALAYKEKAKELHPDRNPNDAMASTKFGMLNEAYSVLKHPGRRLEYDMRRKKMGQNKDSKESGAAGTPSNGEQGKKVEGTNVSAEKNVEQKEKEKESNGEGGLIPNMLSPTADGRPKQRQTSNKTASSTPSDGPSTSSATQPSESSSSSPSATPDSTPIPSNPTPVQIRIGDDGQEYRVRVVKKRPIQNVSVEEKKDESVKTEDNENKEKKEEKNETPTVAVIGDTHVTSATDDKKVETMPSVSTRPSNPPPSSPKSSSSLSPAAIFETALSSLASAAADSRMSRFTPIPFTEVSPLIKEWHSKPLKVFKLSNGVFSFKTTLLHLRCDSNGWSLHWDSNKSSHVPIGSNVKTSLGIKDCTEWSKISNQKKLPNPVEQVQWVFAFQTELEKKGADKDKVHSFCATNNNDFQAITKVVLYIVADHKRKIDERLSIVGKSQ